MKKMPTKAKLVYIGFGCLVLYCLYYLVIWTEPWKWGRQYPTYPAPTVNFTKPVWTFSPESGTIQNLFSAGGNVFVRTTTHLYVINAQNGAIRFEIESQSVPLISFNLSSPPKVYRNILFIPEGKRTLSAYSLETGKLLWRHETVEESYGTPVYSIGFAGNVVCVTRYDAGIQAYDVPTGKLLWQGFAGRGTDILIEGNICYHNLRAGDLDAYESETGKYLGRQTFSSWSGIIMLDEGVLYLLNDDTGLTAFDMRTKKTKWTTPVRWDKTSISKDRETLYVASKEQLTAISIIDGKILWQDNSSFWGIAGKPAILGDTLYLKSVNLIYALDRASGQVLWQMKVKTTFFEKLDPVISSDLLIVPISDYEIQAFRP